MYNRCKTIHFFSNKDKIYDIITKYRNEKFDKVDDFYRKIIFLRVNKNYFEAYTKPTIQDMDFIILENIDKKFKFKNYNLKLIGNVNGLNFAFVAKKLNNKKNIYDVLRELVLRTGGKFYINIPIHKTISLDKKEYNEILRFNNQRNKCFTFKGIEIEITNSNYFSRMFYRDNVNVDMVIYDTDQIVLSTNFIKDIFYVLDRTNFIDAIGLKYFKDYDFRKDRLNIYLSHTLKTSKELSQKLANVLKKLIFKYQKKGLYFDRDNFIMPYEYDNDDRIIANTYVPYSFNKSILFFILLYMNLDISIAQNFFYYNERIIKPCIQEEKYINRIITYIKDCKTELPFEKFVFDIFNLYSDCHIDGYVKTYKKLFCF